jgi:hypothetical protein
MARRKTVARPSLCYVLLVCVTVPQNRFRCLSNTVHNLIGLDNYELLAKANDVYNEWMCW